MRDRLALHTWTLDKTPLAEVLAIATRTGWNAVELRRLDFQRAAQDGTSAEAVLELVRASGLPVAAIGVQLGWMFAEGDERRELLRAFAESCDWASALGCATVMSPVDFASGSVRRAADSLREVGDLAAARGLRLALELQSQAPQFNTLERTREVVDLAGHPACGLLLDTYHVERSGGGLKAYEDVAPAEIVYFQYSDVPRSGLRPGFALDRLPPGQGSVPFADVFRILAAKGYDGYLSYEAPNETTWARDPETIARQAAEATRAILG